LGLKLEEKRANKQYGKNFLTHIVFYAISELIFWQKYEKFLKDVENMPEKT